MDELEFLVKNTSGSIDGKLSQLENTLVEVYDDVQDLLDMQDTVEAQLQDKLETLPQQPIQKPHQTPTVQFAAVNAYCPLPPQQIPGHLPHLPTAKFLPEALPTKSNSGGPTRNFIDVDELVKKVASMGFTNDQARAAVRNLIENGQSVDLNVVLDKLMNN
ncbi:hypothetical protein J5N97_007388 [Dioscorea zingiberensis]|uniref:DUF1421 domain-containing protein n=1 Tax=Dioscorea zingiberensis TaxID=325984 RepID=A0A9D5DFV9_9LILI|nr:hypothetical protein J5N97_007388 [Dioscorea zingiberensis]